MHRIKLGMRWSDRKKYYFICRLQPFSGVPGEMSSGHSPCFFATTDINLIMEKATQLKSASVWAMVKPSMTFVTKERKFLFDIILWPIQQDCSAKNVNNSNFAYRLSILEVTINYFNVLTIFDSFFSITFN